MNSGSADPINRPPSARTAPGLELDDLEPRPRDTLALVILWSAREPERVGETALLYPHVQNWAFGRAPDSRVSMYELEEDSSSLLLPQPLGELQPVQFFRQRPEGCQDDESRTDSCRPIEGEAISRRQLELLNRGDSLLVRNVGRCQLALNGQVAQSGLVAPGDTLYLRGQLLLYCTRRPLRMPPLRAYPLARVRAFGEPDADGMIGESEAMWDLRERLAACARTGFHVLIVGESGSGKELAAQAIHTLSRRCERKLIADNIAAIPPSLAAALLFGNKKNFPNPGMEERVGLIGSANGSTLFLDEIGDMPEEVQPLFLRVADRGGEYFRLGEENRVQRSDFRLVGATNRPEKMRYELKRRFAREIRVPSLNIRKEDIPLLIRHLLAAQAKSDDLDAQRFLVSGQPRIHPRLLEQLVHHTYTTNVSEVAFLIGHAISGSAGDIIRPLCDGLPSQGSTTPVPATPAPFSKKRRFSQPLPPAAQAQRALDENAGHITRAAALLGISRDQLNRMIRREGLVIRRPPRRADEQASGSGSG